MTEELPLGWQFAKLGEITSKIGSGATPRGGSESYQQAGIPLIRSQNVRFEGFTAEGLAFLNYKQAEALKEVTVQSGDVLLNITGASIGRVTQAPSDMAGARVNQHVCIIRLKDGLNATFLAHFLASPAVQEMIRTEQYGVTRQALTKGQILDFSIPVPPIKEQLRIARKLERLLDQVHICQQRLSKISNIIKRIRQSVLSAVCSGRLTADWRLNHRDCQWEDVILTDVIQEKPKNGYSAKPVHYVTPYKVLTLTATTSGIFDGRHFKFFDEKMSSNSPHWLQPDDILIQRGNTIEYVGVPAIYTGLPGEFIYPDLMMRVRANSRVRTKFLYYALSWEDTRKYLRERATGTAGNMPKINQEALMSVPIKLPCLDEQDEIIRRVDNLFTLADNIHTRYTVAKNQVYRLPQSILAKAFRGELVSTEAELAEREGRSYESAEQLLQRIRVAKPEMENRKGGGPTKRRRHAR